MFRWSFLCIRFCPLPFVLLLGTTEESLDPLLGILPLDTHIDNVSSQSALLEAEEAQLPQPSLIREVLIPLIIFALH